MLELLAQRKSNKEIASELCVSLFTVKNHVHNILEKLEVFNRMEAVDIAVSSIHSAFPLKTRPQGDDKGRLLRM